MSQRRTTFQVLRILGCVCIVISLIPWWSQRLLTVPPARIEQDVFTVGVPWGPWIERVKEKKENADDTVTYSTRTTYFPISLSAGLSALGVILLIVGWRMRSVAGGVESSAQ
jgi:hypothetical protein